MTPMPLFLSMVTSAMPGWPMIRVCVLSGIRATRALSTETSTRSCEAAASGRMRHESGKNQRAANET